MRGLYILGLGFEPMTLKLRDVIPTYIKFTVKFKVSNCLFRPSVGLTSLRGFIEAFITSTKLTNGTSNYTFEWNCIFLPDNGAFFVNYVITSALVGTALELMRMSELLSKFKRKQT